MTMQPQQSLFRADAAFGENASLQPNPVSERISRWTRRFSSNAILESPDSSSDESELPTETQLPARRSYSVVSLSAYSVQSSSALVASTTNLMIRWTGKRDDESIFSEKSGQENGDSDQGSRRRRWKLKRREASLNTNAKRDSTSSNDTEDESFFHVQKPLTGPEIGSTYYSYPSSFGPTPRTQSKETIPSQPTYVFNPEEEDSDSPFRSPTLGRTKVIFDEPEPTIEYTSPAFSSHFSPIFPVLSPSTSFTQWGAGMQTACY